MLPDLQKLPVDIVERFLQTRNAESCGIPAKLADYILQINYAANLHKKNSSINDCARKLQKEYPGLSMSTCRQRVYDAINYLNTDCTVTAEAWNLYFADEMMKLRDINLISHNFKEARFCMQESRKYRIAASESAINPDLKKFKQQLVSPDLEIARMGIKKQGLLGAYKKAIDIIKGRDIPESEKQRLIGEVERELNIEDAEYGQ